MAAAAGALQCSRCSWRRRRLRRWCPGGSSAHRPPPASLHPKRGWWWWWWWQWRWQWPQAAPPPRRRLAADTGGLWAVVGGVRGGNASALRRGASHKRPGPPRTGFPKGVGVATGRAPGRCGQPPPPATRQAAVPPPAGAAGSGMAATTAHSAAGSGATAAGTPLGWAAAAAAAAAGRALRRATGGFCGRLALFLAARGLSELDQPGRRPRSGAGRATRAPHRGGGGGSDGGAGGVGSSAGYRRASTGGSGGGGGQPGWGGLVQHAAAGRGWQRGQVAWRRSPHALPPEAPCCRRPGFLGLRLRRGGRQACPAGARQARSGAGAGGAAGALAGTGRRAFLLRQRGWAILAPAAAAPPPARSRCVYGGALCTPHGPRPFLKKAMLPNATCPLCVGPGATNPPITNNQPRPPQGRPPLWRTLGAFFGSCTQTSCPLSSHAPPLGTSQPCFAPPGHPQCPGAGALPLPMNPAMQHWGGGVGRRKAQQRGATPWAMCGPFSRARAGFGGVHSHNHQGRAGTYAFSGTPPAPAVNSPAAVVPVALVPDTGRVVASSTAARSGHTREQRSGFRHLPHTSEVS